MRIIVTLSLIILLLNSCRKSSVEEKDIIFYGQDLPSIKQRLSGTWKNHYDRNESGQVVTFPDCWLNFQFTSADSLIITCNGVVTSRAAMTWSEQVLPQSQGQKTWLFAAAPVNSGITWTLAPEKIENDTLVLLDVGDGGSRNYLTRK